MTLKYVAFVTALQCATAAAAEPVTPARGTDLRQALLDTVRPVAAHDLGAPIEFVVIQLQADGDRAFARLSAQRPGGVPIEMAQTPMVTRDEIPLDFIDGPRIEAFLHFVAGAWTVTDYAVGATDVWWIGPPFCADYAQFLPPAACE